MAEIIQAIIASTSSDDIEFDVRRTDILWSVEAVKMVNQQINIAKEQSIKLPIWQRGPQGKGDHPPEIGEIIGSTIRTDNGCEQCIAEIFIKDASMRDAIVSQKKDYCFVPVIGYNNVVSLKPISQEGREGISLLVPPLKIFAANLAKKRETSNPYYIIL